MIDATDRGDREALLESFAEDTMLTDFGRAFAGRAEISRWNDDENIGNRNRISVTGVTRSDEDGTVAVGITVTGDGCNGPGTLVFSLGAGRIERLVFTA